MVLLYVVILHYTCFLNLLLYNPAEAVYNELGYYIVWFIASILIFLILFVLSRSFNAFDEHSNPFNLMYTVYDGAVKCNFALAENFECEIVVLLCTFFMLLCVLKRFCFKNKQIKQKTCW